MQAKTHITTTLALGLPLMSLTNELTLVNVGVLAVGSLLPDIDHPSSYLGKRHKMVSGVTNKAFGHRGITHSLLGFILIGIIVKFIQNKIFYFFILKFPSLSNLYFIYYFNA